MVKNFLFTIKTRIISILPEFHAFYGRNPLFYLSANFRPIRICGSRFSEVSFLHWSMAAISIDTSRTAFSSKIPSFSVLRNFVNSVYNVNSVYRLKSVFIVAFSLSFLLQMVFSARCLCTKHTTWSHGDVLPDGLRVADSEELRFCEVDTSKNKGRKRKICLACRGRIAAEIKCMRFEVRYFCKYCCNFLLFLSH